MIYQNQCGGWKIGVSDPHPAWIQIEWGAAEIRGLKVEDLRDLRHLIDRAEDKIAKRGAE